MATIDPSGFAQVPPSPDCVRDGFCMIVYGGDIAHSDEWHRRQEIERLHQQTVAALHVVLHAPVGTPLAREELEGAHVALQEAMGPDGCTCDPERNAVDHSWINAYYACARCGRSDVPLERSDNEIRCADCDGWD